MAAARATLRRPLARARARRALAGIALVLWMCKASGCYYAQAVRGQARVLWGRIPLEQALAKVELADEERALLELVPEVLAFADRMGLERGRSYETFYDTGSQPISWNVSACAKTSFTPYTWRFPFVGRVPYKGYFARERAVAEARALEARGDLDVRVSGVSAYSTLGWFRDPLFRSMLRRGRFDLMSTVLHEIAHATIWRQGDVTFNESMATFIGEQGALELLEERFGEGSPELEAARAGRHDAALFQRFMHELYRRLDALYRSDRTDAEKLALREEVFEDARGRFAALRAERFLGDGYGWFLTAPLDNTLVLGYRTYHRDLDTFADVHRLTGGDWPQTLAVFAQAAEAPDAFRHLAAWRFEQWRARLALSARGGGGR